MFVQYKHRLRKVASNGHALNQLWERCQNLKDKKIQIKSHENKIATKGNEFPLFLIK